MSIRIEHTFSSPAEALWAIVGIPDRTDWVPGVAACNFDGSVRRLEMPGAGHIAERILALDNDAMKIEYSCIESTPPMDEHYASMQVKRLSNGCTLTWTTEVRPRAFENFIESSMRGCITQLETLLESQPDS